MHWWKDDGVKLKWSEKTLPQHYFRHHKSQNDWIGIEPDFRCVRPVTNLLSHDRASASVASSVSLNKQRCRTEFSSLYGNNVFNIFPVLFTDTDGYFALRSAASSHDLSQCHKAKYYL